MAINLTEDINHSGGGKIVSVAQSQGSWQSIATKATFDSAFLATTDTKQNLANGQFFYVLDESQLYKLTVSGFGPFSTYTLNSASFGEGIDTGSFLTSADTSSFVLISETSSLSVATASIISDTFISASAVRSGFGAGGSSIPAGTISGSQQITDFGFVSSSVDTSLFVLVSETGSFLTAGDTGSFLTSADTSSFVLISNTSSMSVATASFISDTFISASAVRSGFGAGGGSTDISSLNTFTSSIQTEVDSLTNATSSYLTSVPSGTISGSQQITDLGFVSSSTDTSALNTFTGSIQTEVNSLTSATSSYLTSADVSSFITNGVTSSMSVATASYALYAVSASYEIVTELSSSHAIQADSASFISDTFISASAVRSGFGAGGSGVTSSSLQDMLDASDNQELTLSGSLNLNQPTDADLNYNEVRAGSISALNGGGFWGEISDTNANRTALNIGISADDDNFVETKLYSGEGYNTSDARNIVTTLYPHDYVTSNLQGKYRESSGKGTTGDDSKRAYFEVDINTNSPKYLAPLTASQFLADEIKIPLINNYAGWDDKILTVASNGVIGYRSGSQLLGDINGLSAADISSLNIFTSSIQTEVDSLTNATSSYLTSLPSGTVSGSVQITNVITDTYISASAVASGFGAGGEPTDISSLNIFTGSVQSEVDTLTQATASYVDNTNTVFTTQTQPAVEAGGLYYDGSDFYLGV